MKLRNNYFILRHGEARSNKEQFVSSWPEKAHNPLTEKGIEQVKKIVSTTNLRKNGLILLLKVTDLENVHHKAKIGQISGKDQKIL
jgi:bisphosphoglycerate-dependent phosphoglycerate mutase